MDVIIIGVLVWIAFVAILWTLMSLNDHADQEIDTFPSDRCHMDDHPLTPRECCERK
jgi:hypothetical protein